MPFIFESEELSEWEDHFFWTPVDAADENRVEAKEGEEVGVLLAIDVSMKQCSVFS